MITVPACPETSETKVVKLAECGDVASEIGEFAVERGLPTEARGATAAPVWFAVWAP